jgi:hypothetical protein
MINRWIPTKCIWPQHDQKVLFVYNEDKNIWIGIADFKVDEEKNGWFYVEEGMIPIEWVSHWISIPDLPKE